MRAGGPSLAAFASLVAALLGSALPTVGRTAPVKTLLATPVSEQALPTMSPDLWAKFVSAYVGGAPIVFAGSGTPTLDDCHRAGADYVVVAPFDLRPRLPGMANASGRVAAMTHLLVTNCITGNVVLDQTVDFDSDPQSGGSDGDFEGSAEITWGHAVPTTLAKYPLAFERTAHVIELRPPFAFVDIKSRGALHPGDGLRDFSTPDHKPRAKPIIFTVTQVFDTYVEVTFMQADENPTVGDLVEPLKSGR